MTDPKSIATRTWMIFAGLCLFGLAIIVKVFVIQAFPDEDAVAMAYHFTYKVNEIEPTRGQILSSDGSLLATSVPEYEIRWDSKASYPDSVYKAKLDSIGLCFAQLFGDRSKEDYKQLFRNARAKGDRYKLIIDHVNYNELQVIKKFPLVRLGRNKSGFIFIEKNKRLKPFGSLASRTIGIERTDHKVGIEEAYNNVLAGVKGQQLQQKLPGGVWAPMTDEYIVDPEPGCDVVATIDVHLQDVAHNALERQLIQHHAAWGCAILMEVETGYVRAIANLSRNPETGEYDETLNLAISQGVEPGSTMKLASLMACFDEGLVDLDDTVATGNGIAYFHGKPMKDSNWDEGGNGTITAEQVFEKSSNIGTARLVRRAFANNPQKFLNLLNSYGCGQPLDIALSGEGQPRLYGSTKDEGWSGLSLTQLAIGYETQQTPLQTLAFYNAVANDGVMIRPLFVQEVRKDNRVVERMEPVVIREDFCKSETLRKCRKMMEGVMEEGGTADYVFRNSPYTVAGKTGTAWINEGGSYQDNRYRASFVGYFPAEDPKYSCIVVVHDPRSGVYYGSAVAAPVFKELADKIYSTQLEFHEPVVVVDTTDVDRTRIPVSKNGNVRDLLTVFDALHIEANRTGDSEWGQTSTGKDTVTVASRNIKPGLVPNVVGMGLQDAIYLLESQGMIVRAIGSGTVRRQSIQPGTNSRSNPYITIELL